MATAIMQGNLNGILDNDQEQVRLGSLVVTLFGDIQFQTSPST
jgi:hypothetical protein